MGLGMTALGAQRRKTPQIAQKEIAALNAFARPISAISDATAAGPSPFPRSSCHGRIHARVSGRTGLRCAGRTNQHLRLRGASAGRFAPSERRSRRQIPSSQGR